MAHRIRECMRQGGLAPMDALLTGAHRVKRLHPLVQRDVAALHRGVHGHGEITAAGRFGAAISAVGLNRIRMVDDAEPASAGFQGRRGRPCHL
jgi:hypothetical protein